MLAQQTIRIAIRAHSVVLATAARQPRANPQHGDAEHPSAAVQAVHVVLPVRTKERGNELVEKGSGAFFGQTMLRYAKRQTEKGSGQPNREKVGTVTRSQVREIAEQKFNDMNAIDIEGAMKQIEGTANNMGIVIVED